MEAVPGTYDTNRALEFSLASLVALMKKQGVLDIYIKKLAPNDNSKNQPWFGSHLTDLSFLPVVGIASSPSRSNKTADPRRKIKYQAAIDFEWIDADGMCYPAPEAKLIYYPQYPEVRFSGFLKSSQVSMSEWMSPEKRGRAENRWLVLGVGNNRKIYGYLATPESALSRELAKTSLIEISSVFGKLDISGQSRSLSARNLLLSKLLEIHDAGWIDSQRLLTGAGPTPYKAPNGGGYTLESMLGIYPNGIAEPDYLGWEVKQFGVTGFPAKGAKPSTLMTPEPDGGIYRSTGAIDFVREFGYPDKAGRNDRINFGGKHVAGKVQVLTGLEMVLTGFDPVQGQITDADGAVCLFDQQKRIAASWSFAKLMEHWQRKHAQAVYVPCMRRTVGGMHQYHFGKNIELGTGTRFEMLLSALHKGAVYYDPGIKLEDASGNAPRIKRRSQFRVSHQNLAVLYRQMEAIDLKCQA